MYSFVDYVKIFEQVQAAAQEPIQVSSQIGEKVGSNSTIPTKSIKSFDDFIGEANTNPKKWIKNINILKENKILVPRRSPEERKKNYMVSTQKKIQQYIKNGSNGDLILNGTPITSLPDNLEVEGSLYLSGTQITSLPDNLKVGGDLDACGTQITSLPDNLKVGGSLYLSGTPITSLPDNLKVGGDLDACGTQITSLPDNLKVGGDLAACGTQITSLPDNLKVGGDLYLGGSLNLGGTPLSKKYSEQELRKMVPGVNGKIYL